MDASHEAPDRNPLNYEERTALADAIQQQSKLNVQTKDTSRWSRQINKINFIGSILLAIDCVIFIIIGVVYSQKHRESLNASSLPHGRFGFTFVPQNYIWAFLITFSFISIAMIILVWRRLRKIWSKGKAYDDKTSVWVYPIAPLITVGLLIMWAFLRPIIHISTTSSSAPPSHIGLGLSITDYVSLGLALLSAMVSIYFVRYNNHATKYPAISDEAQVAIDKVDKQLDAEFTASQPHYTGLRLFIHDWGDIILIVIIFIVLTSLRLLLMTHSSYSSK